MITKTPTGSKSLKGIDKTEGTIKELRVSDDNAQELLGEIYKQLKIMNLHLAILSDNTIDKEEL